MKSLIYYMLLGTTFTAVGWFANVAWNLPKEESKIIAEIKPRPLEKYEIENLEKKYLSMEKPTLILEDLISKEDEFSTYKFSFNFDPTMAGGEDKKVTGVINIPKADGPRPLVILFRGYVDQTIYTPGMGSKRVGEYFAKNGYITLAPDFLGYAGSDKESSNIFESRFQTYTTALAMLKMAKTLDNGNLKQSGEVFIWAHSNGGQIALTALEISGANYPTALWAPNSAKFPYSILYYLDEAADNGKLIVTKLAEFMSDYDTDKFAFTNYISKLNSTFIVIQGTGDDAIPPRWTDSLVKKLAEVDPDVKYIKYPGGDHNLNPHWQNAIDNTLSFFQSEISVQ